MLILEIAAGIWVATWVVKAVDIVGCWILQAILYSRTHR